MFARLCLTLDQATPFEDNHKRLHAIGEQTFLAETHSQRELPEEPVVLAPQNDSRIGFPANQQFYHLLQENIRIYLERDDVLVLSIVIRAAELEVHDRCCARLKMELAPAGKLTQTPILVAADQRQNVRLDPHPFVIQRQPYSDRIEVGAPQLLVLLAEARVLLCLDRRYLVDGQLDERRGEVDRVISIRNSDVPLGVPAKALSARTFLLPV